MNIQNKIKSKSETVGFETDYLAEKQRKKTEALNNWLALSYLVKKKSTIEEILEARDEGRR